MMKAPYRMLVMLLCACVFTFAQSVHQVPFASANNTIALSIHNAASISVPSVKVEAANVPVWIRFTSTEQTITQLKGKEDATAAFSLSIDKTAPANKPQTITFKITSSTGEVWTKEISIAVDPPDHFELYQNYPNPFNPATTISYQLPRDAHVTLKIFNSIGQALSTLADDDRSAGYHQEIWNAFEMASGMYIYQLAYTNEHGKKEFYRKKLILLK